MLRKKERELRFSLHIYWTWSFNVIHWLLVDTLLFMPKNAAKNPKGN